VEFGRQSTFTGTKNALLLSPSSFSHSTDFIFILTFSNYIFLKVLHIFSLKHFLHCFFLIVTYVVVTVV